MKPLDLRFKRMCPLPKVVTQNILSYLLKKLLCSTKRENHHEKKIHILYYFLKDEVTLLGNIMTGINWRFF